MMRVSGLTGMVICIMVTAVVAPCQAGVLFFTDSALFQTAIQQQGLTVLATEDFESWTGGALASMNDPLDASNTHGRFSNPLISSLRFQSNTSLGGATVSPRGEDGIFGIAPPDFRVNNAGVGHYFTADSLDILSLEPQLALALIPRNLDGIANSLTVRVFSTSNTQLGIETGLAGDGIGFLGILATDGDTIGRVNLKGLGGNAVVDEISTFTSAVPEPSTLVLFCGMGAALAIFSARRRRKA